METKDIIFMLRTKSKLSQDELAEKLFVTRQAVSRWEKGETIPNTETLKLLSKLFNISINTLLGSPKQLMCQCCGMPLEDNNISKETDGSFNEQYCKWCYADGKRIYTSGESVTERNIGNNCNLREVMWDFELADKISNVSLKNHKPERRNIAFVCDAPYEGEYSTYSSLVKDGDIYRMYYRGAGHDNGPSDIACKTHGYICVAESRDGKNFTRPNLGIFEYGGSKDNNIIMTWKRDDGRDYMDNFSVYLDENPMCPPDERYKALTSCFFGRLDYYKSADGYHFEFVRSLSIKKGAYDTLNCLLWNPMTEEYHVYFRDYHRYNGDDVEFNKHMIGRSIRDIRVVTSKDMITWSEPLRLDYKGDADMVHLYTNNITKYHRANVFFGHPVRYKMRGNERINFKYINNLCKYRERSNESPNIHEFTIATDCMLITSRDGKSFYRSNEPFIASGVQNGYNWVYGDGYIARGLFETESDYPDEPNEMSFYAPFGSRTRPVYYVRYALRLDGFCSWSSDNNGGYVLTKVTQIDADSMNVNFSTSAIGYLRVKICDENGDEIEGYDSGTLFGDDVARPVEFQKPLSELRDINIRLKFEMMECDLYSFIFE